MPIGFVIMQIGEAQLDEMYERAIEPALRDVGLEPRRVDRHNEGGLLKSEIVGFIQQAEILVADVTNERPNCYLEIGYAMGLDKFRQLILTVREDHFVDSPNHRTDGPRVHFDLGGYDILRWHQDKPDEFRRELEQRIRRRRAIAAPRAGEPPLVWDSDWIQAQRNIANGKLADLGVSGFMELSFAQIPPKPDFAPPDLDRAAHDAPLHTFGWPIGVYLGRDDARPQPRSDGIFAVVESHFDKDAFDYWALRRNGDFYLAATLFEDQRSRDELFFNTRIVRVTEALLYCARLYASLGVDVSKEVALRVRHGGLKGRQLTASSLNRSLTPRRPAAEAEVEAEVRFVLNEVDGRLVELVVSLCQPLFAMFDFAEIAEPVYRDIIDKFVAGQVT